jgi:uncharacterized repeat protein (TIGR01451 family)
VFRATVLGVPNSVCNNTVGGYSPDTYIVTRTNLAPVTILPPFIFSKTVSPASVVLSNSIQYTVSLYNNGGVSATLDIFTDTLPAGFYYNGLPAYVDTNDFVLLPNQTNYYRTTFTVKVITTSLPCDSLPSIVYQAPAKVVMKISSPPEVAGNWGNPANIAGVLVLPHAQVSKFADPANWLPGDVVTYTIVLTNNTNALISNIRLTDTLPAGFIYGGVLPGTPAEFAVSGSNVFWIGLNLSGGIGTTSTLAFTVTASSTLGSYTNQVKAASLDDPLICIPKATSTGAVKAGLIQINKTATPNSVSPLGQFVYNISLNNVGPYTVTLSRFTETLPGVSGYLWKYVSMQSGDPLPSLTDPVVWTNLSIGPGKTQNLRFTVRTETQVGIYPNLIYASSLAGYMTGTLPARWSLTTTNGYNNSPVTVVPGIGLAKEVDRDTAAAGEVVTYTITVANFSGQAINNIRITDTLPSGFKWDSYVSGDVPISSNPVVWSSGSMPNGTTKLLVFRVLISDTEPSGTYYNRVSLTADNVSIAPLNNAAPVFVIGIPALSLSKAVDPLVVVSGHFVTYTLDLSNLDISNTVTARVTDTLPISFSFAGMISGTAPDITGTQIVWNNFQVSSNSSQQLIFKALVSPDAPDGTYTNQLDGSSAQTVFQGTGPTAPVSVLHSPAFDVQISKTDEAYTNTLGGTRVYTLYYTNTLNTLGLTAQNVIVTDTFSPSDYLIADAPGWTQAAAGVYTYSIGDLTAGASGSITLALTVSPTIPIDYLTVTNTAQISADAPTDVPEAIEQPTSNNTSSDVDIIRSADLAINVVGSGTIDQNPPSPYRVGDAVTLTANAATGWTFTSWSGDLAGTTNPITIALDSDKVVTATFTINTYVITPTAGSNGSMTPGTPQTVNYGSSITFTLVPSTGYHAADVRVDGVAQGALSSYTFTNVVTNHTITAAFAINTYTLTVAAAGNGSGVVTPSVGAYVYTYGMLVTPTASANTGSTFTGWSGNCSGLGTCALTMLTAKSVTATFTLNTYMITPTSGSNGSIVPGVPQTVNYGSSITFTIVPSTGYHATDVRVDGVSQGVLSSYTFTNVVASHTITAAYAINTYTLTPTAGSNGSITPSTSQTVNYGSSITFTIAANANYHTTDVRIDGVSQGVLSSYTFTNVATNHTITSAYAINTYIITPTAGSNGSITPSALQTVNYGSSITFTIAANTGYHTTDVRVDGVSQGVLSSYTFTNVVANHIITSAYAINTYLITPTAGSNGSIVPGTPQTVNYGSSITFTIAGNTGYHTTDVRVDGVSQGVLSSYTFTNVVANHIITSAYAINTYVITPTAGSNGLITPSTPQTVNYGSSITFTIAANTGYHTTDVRVDGVSQGVLSSYTFSNVVANHMITSAYAINTYLITPTAGSNGSIIPSTPQTVNYGSSITFTIVPTGGYGIADVRVDGVSQGSIGTYTFNNVTASHTITAAFANNLFVITPTAGLGGSLNPSSPQAVSSGNSITFTITANTGYHTTDVHVDGVSQGAIGAYTFNNVIASHTITAAFAINMYTLTVSSAGAGSGLVTPTVGIHTYPYGMIVTPTASANSGSIFSGWSGNCSGAGACVVTMITNRSVTVNFGLNTAISYTLAITTAGAGSGNVTPPAGVYSYVNGTVVTLTAAANSGSVFTGWGGSLTGAANPVTLTVNGDKVVTVTFALGCVSVSGVGFSYLPTIPVVGKVITFNGVVVTGTLPVTYSWNYGDSSPLGSGSPITHIFPITITTRSYTVTLTAANACSSQPGAALLTVRPYQLYLPVIMKNTP